jgi:hypothetical protein
VVPPSLLAEARAALAAVEAVTWGFAYGSNKWNVPMRSVASFC